MDSALLGALAATGLGAGVGLVLTWLSIRHAESPRERRFVMRCAAAAWAIITTFVLCLLAMPLKYQHLMWIAYAVVLFVAITRLNRAQNRIRDEETRRPRPPATNRA